MAEKRLYQRKFVNARVNLQHASFGEIESITHNISNGGVFVVVAPEHELPESTELRMQLLESSDPDVVFHMQVVRHDKAGMAMKFLNFESDGEFYDMDDLQRIWPG